MFAGIAPDNVLPEPAWRFHLQLLACVFRLMGQNWGLLVRAWPTGRGAPLPLPAVLDLLANVYNSETPTELPVRGLCSRSRLCSLSVCMFCSLLTLPALARARCVNSSVVRVWTFYKAQSRHR
jgi:hypothetical protein